MNQLKQCPFCEIAKAHAHQRIIAENEHAFLIRDGYPVSDGHSLIILRRHISSFFETTEPERHALLQLIDKAKSCVDSEYHPDAYNIGINDGSVAGQTVPHLHVHLIPRYENDVVDPRGGVRWIVPEKADYWSQKA